MTSELEERPVINKDISVRTNRVSMEFVLPKVWSR